MFDFLQVIMDQLVNATASNALYFTAVPYLEGRADAEWMWRKLRLDLWPTLLVDLVSLLSCVHTN